MKETIKGYAIVAPGDFPGEKSIIIMDSFQTTKGLAKLSFAGKHWHQLKRAHGYKCVPATQTIEIKQETE